MITKRNLLWVCLLCWVSKHRDAADLKLAAIFGDNMLTGAASGAGAIRTRGDVRFARRNYRADENGPWLVKLRKLEGIGQSASGRWSTENRKRSRSRPKCGWHQGSRNTAKLLQSPGRLPNRNPAVSGRTKSFHQTIERPGEVRRLAGTAICNVLRSKLFRRSLFLWPRDSHGSPGGPESSWGGTRIEPRTRPAGFIQGASSAVQLATPQVASSDTVLFNERSRRLRALPVRGALWYQGANPTWIGGPESMTAIGDRADNGTGPGTRPLFADCALQILPAAAPGARPRRTRCRNRGAPLERRIKHSGSGGDDGSRGHSMHHLRHKQDAGAVSRRRPGVNLRLRGSKVPVRYHPGEIHGRQGCFLKFKNVGNGLMSTDGKPLTWFERLPGRTESLFPRRPTIWQRLKFLHPRSPNLKAVRFA